MIQQQQQQQQQRMPYHNPPQVPSRGLCASTRHTTTLPPLQQQQQQQQQQRLYYHTTTHHERSAVAIVLGLGAVSVGAYAIASVVTAVKEFQQHVPPPPPPPSSNTAESNNATGTNDSTKSSSSDNDNTTTGDSTTTGTTTNNAKDNPSSTKNIFDEWFGIGVNHKYYDGGFEATMTRREAALILGIRESSTTARIKDAHRKLLILNHPDTGGSTYLTHKINEAKELLLKGRTDK
jgi:hypothetical protein